MNYRGAGKQINWAYCFNPFFLCFCANVKCLQVVASNHIHFLIQLSSRKRISTFSKTFKICLKFTSEVFLSSKSVWSLLIQKNFTGTGATVLKHSDTTPSTALIRSSGWIGRQKQRPLWLKTSLVKVTSWHSLTSLLSRNNITQHAHVFSG